MLSNKTSKKKYAKYKLEHVVRIHHRAGDAAYHAAYQEGAKRKMPMVKWASKDLMRIAVETLAINMKALGPFVLPYNVAIILSYQLPYEDSI